MDDLELLIKKYQKNGAVELDRLSDDLGGGRSN